MRRKNSRCRASAGLPLAALAALILSPLSSPAATTYNFTGTGSVDTAISSGWANWKGTFVGQVILDVVGIPTDTGSNYASGEGWVISTFVINWDEGSYESGPVLGENYRSNLALAADNSGGWDTLYAEFTSVKTGAYSALARNRASFRRETTATSWLTSTAFDLSKTLTPNGGLNEITFENMRFGSSGRFSPLPFREHSLKTRSLFQLPCRSRKNGYCISRDGLVGVRIRRRRFVAWLVLVCERAASPPTSETSELKARFHRPANPSPPMLQHPVDHAPRRPPTDRDRLLARRGRTTSPVRSSAMSSSRSSRDLDLARQALVNPSVDAACVTLTRTCLASPAVRPSVRRLRA